jgi:hypothetical protein
MEVVDEIGVGEVAWGNGKVNRVKYSHKTTHLIMNE